MTEYLLWDQYHNITQCIYGKDEETISEGIKEMMDELGTGNPDDLEVVLYEPISDIHCAIGKLEVAIGEYKEK